MLMHALFAFVFFLFRTQAAYSRSYTLFIVPQPQHYYDDIERYIPTPTVRAADIGMYIIPATLQRTAHSAALRAAQPETDSASDRRQTARDASLITSNGLIMHVTTWHISHAAQSSSQLQVYGVLALP